MLSHSGAVGKDCGHTGIHWRWRSFPIKRPLSAQVEMVPRHRRDAAEKRHRRRVAGGLLGGNGLFQDGHIVEDDQVDQQPAGLIPHVLFVLADVAQLAGVAMG